MKKAVTLVLSLVIIFLFAPVQKSEQDQTSPAQSTSSADGSVLSTVAVTENPNAAEEKSEKFKALEKYNVDIDFNGLNKTMTTAQMNSITNDPSKYLGKTVRLTATYQKQKAETGDKTYNFAFGYDDTGCCAAWYVEFYGDSVPENIEDFSSVSMVGKLAQYDENGAKYLYIDVEHFAV